MANHSYIPHDGKGITFDKLVHALHVGYGISIGFSSFLVLGSYILLRRSPLQTLDLKEISRHGRIEHNDSVTLKDANGAEYAPTEVDVELLRDFLTGVYRPAGTRDPLFEDIITIEDVAWTRIERQAKCGPIDKLHAEIARGEFAMVLNIFGKGAGNYLYKDDLKTWLHENRFPDGWAPTHKERLWHTVAESKKIRDLVKKYQREKRHERHRVLWQSILKAAEGLLPETKTHPETTTRHPEDDTSQANTGTGEDNIIGQFGITVKDLDAGACGEEPEQGWRMSRDEIAAAMWAQYCQLRARCGGQ